MPDATKYHELNISEATVFDPTTTSRSSRISNSSVGVGVTGLVWVASKVWQAVGQIMFGVKSYDQRDEDEEEKESRGNSYRSRRNLKKEDESDRLSWILPSRTNTKDLDRICGDEDTRIYAPQDLDDPPFSDLEIHQSPQFLIPSSTPSTSTSLSHTNSSNIHSDSETIEDLHLDVPYLNGSQSRHYPTGSSGSTGGSLVYVRMSDGKLVSLLDA